ncbi:MAG: hypothetical protein DRJ40_10970 [Thermoprotei archaeon]|nr:MAG: hypothetical protein DRJ40_10970 [Thermoprotei archaeon]
MSVSKKDKLIVHLVCLSLKASMWFSSKVAEISYIVLKHIIKKYITENIRNEAEREQVADNCSRMIILSFEDMYFSKFDIEAKEETQYLM